MAQSFTYYKIDLYQDINRGFAIIRCLNGTFPWSKCSVKAPANDEETLFDGVEGHKRIGPHQSLQNYRAFFKLFKRTITNLYLVTYVPILLLTFMVWTRTFEIECLPFKSLRPFRNRQFE